MKSMSINEAKRILYTVNRSTPFQRLVAAHVLKTGKPWASSHGGLAVNPMCVRGRSLSLGKKQKVQWHKR